MELPGTGSSVSVRFAVLLHFCLGRVKPYFVKVLAHVKSSEWRIEYVGKFQATTTTRRLLNDKPDTAVVAVLVKNN